MAGYAIIDVYITDQAAFSDVLEKATPVVEAHGGRYLVRGGATEVVQGNWAPQRLVLLEFDSIDRARAWSKSPDYAELRALLNKCSNANIAIAEGV